MNKEPVTHSSLTRNFLIEADDLVDEILSALKKFQWTNLKMNYELSTLCATRTVEGIERLAASAVTYVLTAKWTEQEEEVELTIAVENHDGRSTAASCQQYCREMMDSLFAESAFRRVNDSQVNDRN